MTLSPGQIRVLRKIRDGTHKSSRNLYAEGALMKRGLIARDPRGGWTATKKGWGVELPNYYYVTINGVEREVELTEDGWFLWGGNPFPLARLTLAGALEIGVEDVVPCEGGVLLRGAVHVEVR